MGCIGGFPSVPYRADPGDYEGVTCPDGSLAVPLPPPDCPGGPADDADWRAREDYEGWVDENCPHGDDPPQTWPAGCPDGPASGPVPGLQCPDGSVPTGPTAPPGCYGGLSREPPAEATTCPDGSEPRDPVADERLRNILGLDETGELHPLEAYDIGCDEGAWDHFLRKMWCAAQAAPFALGKWAVGLGVDLMGWALEFRLASSLTPVAGMLSEVYDTSLVGPLGLRHFAWTLALFVAGWHLMRAQAARGIAEVAETVLIAAVGAIVLANPQGYLEGSVTLARNTSGAVLEAIDDTLQDGDADTDADAVRGRLGDMLRTSFVAEPYDLINWGEQLSGDCARAREEILDGGPWGADDQPRDIMRDHGCDTQADFNARPSDSRAAASLIVGLAAIAATVLLVAVALGVFVAQLTLVALFAGASLVWAVALFPGARELLWWWIGRLAWAVAATITATFVLSWLAVTVTAVLAESSDISIIQRSLVALLVVAFGFRLRGHLSRLGEQASHRFGSSLGRLSHAQTPGFAANGPGGGSGGGSGGGGGGGGGGVGGGGLAAMARSWAYDMPGGQYGYNRLYARHFTRGHRRRYPGPIRRTLHHVGDASRRLTDSGATAARTGGRVARAAVMAPVLGPQAYAATRVRATAASARARSRLQDARAQARTTRQHWVHNTRHPIQAVRAAHRQAPQTTNRPQRAGRTTGGAGTTAPASAAQRTATTQRPRRAPAQRATASTPTPDDAGASQAPRSSTTARIRAQLQQARAARQRRAREGGHLIRTLLDTRREAKQGPLTPKNPNHPRPGPPDDPQEPRGKRGRRR